MHGDLAYAVKKRPSGQKNSVQLEMFQNSNTLMQPTNVQMHQGFLSPFTSTQLVPTNLLFFHMDLAFIPSSNTPTKKRKAVNKGNRRPPAHLRGQMLPSLMLYFKLFNYLYLLFVRLGVSIFKITFFISFHKIIFFVDENQDLLKLF